YSAKENKGSGREEPVLTVNTYGKGRCVNLMLGHDRAAMSHPKFATLLRRSVTWASGRDHHKSERISFRETEHSIAMCYDQQIVWQFLYAPTQTKPYFHPIALSDGTVLTWVAPQDHPWHYGLWFSWKFINGINYWEEDRVTGKAAGLTTWDSVRIRKHDDGAVNIHLHLSYQEPNQSAVLTEDRTIAISASDDTGRYNLDWHSVFTAQSDHVELNRTPIPGEPKGKPYGGYAGLSFRAHQDVQAVQYTTDVMSLTEQRYRGRARAVEYAGERDGQSFGVAILDHPDNVNAPTPWYLDNGKVMDYFSPAVLYDKPLVLKREEKLTLRYRVIVHYGRWDSERLRSEYQIMTFKKDETQP
ncbi:MAG: PmoA family protein, partial [Bacteroidales bacterium]|nr:PmoA family protein [Bacteroidales bacterium]